jgi:hypothetical protein
MTIEELKTRLIQSAPIISTKKEPEEPPIQCDEETHLLCPACQSEGDEFEYGHIVSINTDPRNNEHEMFRTDEIVYVRLDVECENGHRWNLVIRQHKGTLEMLRVWSRERKVAE